MNVKKHRKVLLEQVDEKDIIEEEAGVSRYIALTNDAIYIVSVGFSSGSVFGKKVKSFPIKHITSIDLSQKWLTCYLEITAAGMGGNTDAHAKGTLLENENIVSFLKDKRGRFQEIVNKTRELMNGQQSGNSSGKVADEIKSFHELMGKGIISKEEFEQKKNKLLGL